MAEDEVVNKINSDLKGIVQNVESSRARRIKIEVIRESLLDAVQYLINTYGVYHISTISTVDLGESFEVLYHLFGANKLFTVSTKVPKTDPTVNTLTGILPGAILYEREIHDLMGVVAKGHPDLKILVLPDSWGNKGHPLRKDWSLAKYRGEE